MKINNKKTKIIPFNFSKKFDFLPQLHFPNHDPIEVIYETRLLGVTITSNLSWTAHVDDITKRATQKLWVLIRFKSLGGTSDQLTTVYQTRVRSTLEFAAPVFHSGLTKDQSRQIESVQKKAWVGTTLPMSQHFSFSSLKDLTSEESTSATALPSSLPSPLDTSQCSPQTPTTGRT